MSDCHKRMYVAAWTQRCQSHRPSQCGTLVLHMCHSNEAVALCRLWPRRHAALALPHNQRLPMLAPMKCVWMSKAPQAATKALQMSRTLQRALMHSQRILVRKYLSWRNLHGSQGQSTWRRAPALLPRRSQAPRAHPKHLRRLLATLVGAPQAKLPSAQHQASAKAASKMPMQRTHRGQAKRRCLLLQHCHCQHHVPYATEGVSLCAHYVVTGLDIHVLSSIVGNALKTTRTIAPSALDQLEYMCNIHST